MALNYNDDEIAGIDNVIEMIQEKLNDLNYELSGPESYDSDYKKDLKDNGLWEQVLSDWVPPTNHAAIAFEIEIWCKATDLCLICQGRLIEQAQESRKEWNSKRGETTYATNREADFYKYHHRFLPKNRR